MKKIVLGLILASFTLAPMAAQADSRHHRHRGHNHGYHWVPPLIGGAIIGGIIVDQYYRSPPEYYPPPTYYPPPVYYPSYPRDCRQYRRMDRWGNIIITEECF